MYLDRLQECLFMFPLWYRAHIQEVEAKFKEIRKCLKHSLSLVFRMPSESMKVKCVGHQCLRKGYCPVVLTHPIAPQKLQDVPTVLVHIAW